MVAAWGIIVDIVLAIKTILDRISDDLCCWVVTGDHPSGTVNDCARKGKALYSFFAAVAFDVTLVHSFYPPWI